MTDLGYYVVLAEYKDDAPICHETYLHAASYEEAHGRMQDLKKSHNIIRVAMARLEYITGNEDLFSHEKTRRWEREK